MLLNNRLKVNIFTENLSKETYAYPSLEAFAKGVQAYGDDANLITKLKYEACDIAVIFGDVREGKGKEKRMRFKAEVKGRHIHRGLIVIDTAILTRASPVGHLYRRIGIDGLLRDEADFVNKDMPPDRWNKVAHHANINVRPWCKDGKHIVIALQRPLDASLKFSENRRPMHYKNWLMTLVKSLEKFSDIPIYVRPHPGCFGQPLEEEWMQLVQKELPEYIIWDTRKCSFEELLKDCIACITYNSGAGVDAAIAGVPVVAYDSGSFAWDIAMHDVSIINNPVFPERTQWLNNLSYVEWNLEEIEKGLPWKHLKPSLLKKV